MQRERVPLLIAAAMLIGCSGTESQTPTEFVPPTTPVAVARVSLPGTVVVNPNGEISPSPIVLRAADGTIVGLQGMEAASMASVIGAEVRAWGTLDGTQLDVDSFLVLAVDGLPASDGVLELTGESYALRLTDGGQRDVINPPAALKAHVGERVWLTGADDAPPTAFGVITTSANIVGT